MNDRSDASNNKPIPTPVPTGPGSTAAPGSLSAGAATGSDSVSGTGTAGGPGMGAKMGTDSGSGSSAWASQGSAAQAAGSQPAGQSSQRQDYSSSAGEDPGFEGTAAALDSLPVSEAMQEMVEVARQFVREHPLAAVAGAVLVGMVLGRR